MIIDAIYVFGYVLVGSGMLWRFICLFRKKGSCKFRACPFRKDYISSCCVYFPSGGCRKCPPTEEEMAIYARTPEGYVESILKRGK